MSDAPIIRLNGNNTPAIRGTRLTVYSIMDYYFRGRSAEFVADLFHVPVEDIIAAQDYVDSHMSELMPPYQRMLEQDRQGDSPEVRARYAESHARLMARKEEVERRNSGGAGDVRVAG